MNIIKNINRHHLLTLPFLVVPLLVTHRFQDPTLLIKRSGVFFLFFVIAIILWAMKSSKNIMSTTNLKWLTGSGAFIIIVAIISNYNSINPSESYWELLYLSGWISIYTIFMIYSTKKTIKYIIVTSSIVSAMLSLLIFNDALNWLSIVIPSKGIMGATFGYRNYFGQYLCFTIPASVISLFILKSDKNKLFMLVCCILNFSGLILSRTRAAWLGVFVAIVILIFLNRKEIFFNLTSFKRNYKLISISFIIGTLLILLLKMPISITNKGSVWSTLKTLTDLEITGDDFKHLDAKWGGRLNMYKSSLGIIKQNPLLGTGLGNWRLLSPKYSNNLNVVDRPSRYERHWEYDSYTKITQRPHNDFLWLLSELGIGGMIFVLGFFIYHLKLLFQVLNKNLNKDEMYIFMFCLASFIAIFVESMFDFPHQRTTPNLYLWSIMGFISTSSIQNAVKTRHQNTVPKVLAIILLIVSVFAYFDMKSNIYSQDARYYNNNNMPNELYASSAIALNYYRNLDNAGTPIYYYMGIAKHQLGDKNAAKFFFQKSVQLAPFHIGALTNYMIVLGELGELTLAYKIMNIIKQVYPRLPKPRLDMAKFYLREGQDEKAEKILLNMKKNNIYDEKGTLKKLLLHVNRK